ncbi:MAG TPA: DUF362 domain-containing protein [Vicinamibacterales bacterium]|nr:DUF362 domain-containing protein [Vicinamibacterales bacterium]
MTDPLVSCHTKAAARVGALVREELRRWAGHLSPKQVVIKPNWVMHEFDPAYPIVALVTDARVIVETVRATFEQFPTVEKVTVGDCLEQRADWPLLCEQSGLRQWIGPLEAQFAGRLAFRDLRNIVFKQEGEALVEDADALHGDPAGYREVQLKSESHLEPIADQADNFSIHDHDTSLTRGGHRPGDHRYLVCQSVLDADLIVNLPKWKAHSKSGLTGALKNLVGINGDKSYLPHFRRGSPRWGGDEYSDEGRWLYWVQNNLYQLVRGTAAYDVLRPGWRLVKQVNNAVRRRSSKSSMPSDFYVVGGSWHGNQTVWRMIYDLNLVLQRADRQGQLQPTPQRASVTIVDGLVSGEGDGPLKARPRDTDMLIAGRDPFAIDTSLAWMMGFDPARIPMLARRDEFLGDEWGAFALSDLAITVDGVRQRLIDSPINFNFAPAPGWLGHIERHAAAKRA